MNKLQLYITTSASGYSKKLEINTDPAIQPYISDLAEALEQIKYIPQEKHIFYLLKYVEEGCFIIIIRTIPDRQGDHLAAWLFVPAELDIRSNDLTGIVDGVKSLVTNSRITSEDMSRLRLLFDKTYPDTVEAAMVGNYGVQYAHRYYGADTGYRLTDLIGNMRYQTSYLPFAGVILADKDDVTEIDGIDLTKRSLRKMVTMLAPDCPDDSPWQPNLFDTPFVRPFLVPLNDEIDIVWENPGKDNVIQTIMVTGNDMHPAIPSAIAQRSEDTGAKPSEEDKATAEGNDADTQTDQTPDADIAEATETANVTEGANDNDSTNDTAADTATDNNSGTVNDSETVNANESANITEAPKASETTNEAEATNATETANEAEAANASEGTDDGNASHDNDTKAASHKKDISSLLDRERVYLFEVPAKSASIGSVISFEIRTKSELTQSPLEGYEATDIIMEGANRINHLVYAADNRRRGLIWGACGIIIGIIVCLLAFWIFADKNIQEIAEDSPLETVVNTIESTEPVEAATTVISTEEAIKYLDSNNRWTRSKMEQYQALQGLFDDMNNFEFRKLIDVWGPKLSASTNMGKIVDHAEKSLRAKKPTRKNIKPPYLPNPQDSVIGVQGYLNRIDP